MTRAACISSQISGAGDGDVNVGADSLEIRENGGRLIGIRSFIAYRTAAVIT